MPRGLHFSSCRPLPAHVHPYHLDRQPNVRGIRSCLTLRAFFVSKYATNAFSPRAGFTSRRLQTFGWQSPAAAPGVAMHQEMCMLFHRYFLVTPGDVLPYPPTRENVSAKWSLILRSVHRAHLPSLAT